MQMKLMIEWVKNEIGKYELLYPILCLSTLLSLCFIPPIPLNSNIYIRFEDLLLPVVFISIIPHLKKFNNFLFKTMLVWAFYAIFTMAVNHRLGAYNDYFEIYKFFKFSVFALLFYLFFEGKWRYLNVLYVVLTILFLINLFHYYNVFRINEVVLPYYSTNILHLTFFGKNTLGFPDAKRIIGTMGNPNINAIFFSIFSVMLIPFVDKKGFLGQKLLFYITFGLVLMTQSRTGFATLIIVYIIYFLWKRPRWKYWLYFGLNLSVVVFVVYLMDPYSLDYFINFIKHLIDATAVDSRGIQDGSLRGRMEAWKMLIGMIAEKPWFGYGINKNFFYSNTLFSENEYILMAWRYGLIGLIFYFTLLFGLIVQHWKLVFSQENEGRLQFVLIVVIYALNAVTNNPVSDPVLLVFFAMATGLFLTHSKEDEKN